YELTGSDLIAQLKESEEIKINKPLYNRALKRNVFQYQLVSFVDSNGYIHLKIEKADSRKKAITTFTNYQQAKNYLFKVCGQYGLCQRFTGLHQAPSACFAYTIRECNGACVGNETPEQYNSRVNEFVNNISFHKKSILIIDKGT